MHELSVAIELLRACHADVEARGGGRLQSVSIHVGELSGVEPILLARAWPAVVAGSPHEGARLVIDSEPAEQSCPACGVIAERQPGTWLRLCPLCDGPLRVQGGDALDIVTLTYIEEEVHS